MKKYLFLYALLATAVIFFGAKHLLRERSRLENNQTALMEQVDHYRTRLGEEVAEVQALRLRCTEFERLRDADAEKIRSLGIRLRRVEATAKSTSKTGFTAKAPIESIIVAAGTDSLPPLVGDTLRTFRWNDAWVSLCGTIRAGSVECSISSVDTLYQVVYRVPRRFLGIPFGTKAIRQSICSANPHTRIVYTEYVAFERRRGRRR